MAVENTFVSEKVVDTLNSEIVGQIEHPTSVDSIAELNRKRQLVTALLSKFSNRGKERRKRQGEN